MYQLLKDLGADSRKTAMGVLGRHLIKPLAEICCDYAQEPFIIFCNKVGSKFRIFRASIWDQARIDALNTWQRISTNYGCRMRGIYCHTLYPREKFVYFGVDPKNHEIDTWSSTGNDSNDITGEFDLCSRCAQFYGVPMVGICQHPNMAFGLKISSKN